MGTLNEHITPAGYLLGGDPVNSNPFFEGGPGPGPTPGGTVNDVNFRAYISTASIDDPQVFVTKSVNEETGAINFEQNILIPEASAPTPPTPTTRPYRLTISNLSLGGAIDTMIKKFISENYPDKESFDDVPDGSVHICNIEGAKVFKGTLFPSENDKLIGNDIGTKWRYSFWGIGCPYSDYPGTGGTSFKWQDYTTSASNANAFTSANPKTMLAPAKQGYAYGVIKFTKNATEGVWDIDVIFEWTSSPIGESSYSGDGTKIERERVTLVATYDYDNIGQYVAWRPRYDNFPSVEGLVDKGSLRFDTATDGPMLAKTSSSGYYISGAATATIIFNTSGATDDIAASQISGLLDDLGYFDGFIEWPPSYYSVGSI